MKRIFYIIIIAVLVNFTACEDYLETAPYSFTSPENFYQSAKEAEMALSGVYNVINTQNVQGKGNVSTFARDLPCMLNGATDEVVIKSDYNNAGLTPFGNAGFTSDNEAINTVWFWFYAGINRANYLIDKLDGIDDFQGNRKIEIEAEARLLRGFYHMILSMMHGGIPVYSTPIQDESQERQSIQEVYDLILSDYEFAFENLPHRASIASHVNKWTAAGLLAKAHTYLASAKTSGTSDFGLALNSFAWVDADSHYQVALSYTTQIIQNSGYTLIPNYDYLFREATKSYQYEESLFSAEAANSPGMEVFNMLVFGFCPQGNANVNGGSYGFFRPTGEIYKKYDAADVRFSHNLTGNLGGQTNNFEEIDGVKYYIPGALNTGAWTYSIGKYRAMDPKLRNLPGWANSITIPLLRYADVVLLHAEAQYFTGDEVGARNTLTLVRERAVMEGHSVEELNTAYHKSDFIEDLLDSRSRELCFEQWRRFDLARFNKYDEAIANMSADFGFYNNIVPLIKQNWKPERIWIPIPLAQIDLNPNLVQNPGF
jgi:hypothetical protein